MQETFKGTYPVITLSHSYFYGNSCFYILFLHRASSTSLNKKLTLNQRTKPRLTYLENKVSFKRYNRYQ